MNRPLIFTLLTTALLSVELQAADILGIEAGAGSWQIDYDGDLGENNNKATLDELGYDDKSHANTFYIVLEHPVPLLPNVKLQHTDLDQSERGTISRNFTINNVTFNASENVKTSLDLTHTDASLYYEILDNWLNADVGMTLRYFSGSATAKSATRTENVDLNVVTPMLYGNARFDLPFTGWSVGVAGNYVNYDSNRLQDYSANIGYNSDGLLMDIGVEVGYRRLSLDLDDLDDLEADIDLDGIYGSLFLRF